MAKVGDAGASNLSQAGQRRRVGAGAEDEVDPVATSFQRGTVVRRRQEDELAEVPQPVVPRELAVSDRRSGPPIRPCCARGRRARRPEPARRAARASISSANAWLLVEMWRPLL